MKGKTIGTMLLLLLTMVLIIQWMCRPKPNMPTERHTQMANNRFTVYGYMKCPYTVKMLDELTTNDQSFTFVDVHTSVGNMEFNKVLDGRKDVGVPYTIDHETGEHMLGYKKINI